MLEFTVFIIYDDHFVSQHYTITEQVQENYKSRGTFLHNLKVNHSVIQ